MNFRLKAYALQDIGRRDNQEDCFFPPFIDPCHYDESNRDWSFYDGTPHGDDRLFIVCDGMGGHDRGELASQLVTRTMSESLLRSAPIEGPFSDETLRSAVGDALEALRAEDIDDEIRKMGTTMTVLKFHAEGATIGHIGDSRVYHFRPASDGKKAEILFRTQDHTVVNDLVKKGEMTPEEAAVSRKRHVLSRSLTSSKSYTPELDIHHVTDIQAGDIFMLCTDGIYESLGDEELCSLVCNPDFHDAELAQQILNRTNANKDNHTAFVVRVQEVFNSTTENSSSECLLPGTVLKSQNYTYHVEKSIGHGAFGITYLVSTSVTMRGQLGTFQTGVRLAMKEFFMHNEMRRCGSSVTVTAHEDKVKTFSEKFRREALKLAMLSHPNIIKVLEVFEANNTIYYTMEYVPDGSLNDYINKRGGLPEQEALGYVRQIGSALSYIHANKMLHLDIKPSNVMRDITGETLKIIDFGLAQHFDSDDEDTSSSVLGAGTAGYAPLEQSSSTPEKELSPQMDVYALGATYYKMLSATVPDRAFDVLNNGLDCHPLVRKHVSEQSIKAIKAAMQPMPKKRLKTIREFLDMLPHVDDSKIYRQKKGGSRIIWAVVIIAFLVILLAIINRFL